MPIDTERYSRHLSLPEIGPAGQEKLSRARILIIGAGGLGSPVALYLAAAGVGTLGIADHDLLEVSNLQRQVLYGTDDLLKPKVLAAVARLHGGTLRLEDNEPGLRVVLSLPLENDAQGNKTADRPSPGGELRPT